MSSNTEKEKSAIKVVVAMSGGVDSSVAAYLLKKEGYDVIGITMQLWNHGDSGQGEKRFDSCCSLSDVNDARMVAYEIGIPHYVINYEKEFKRGVVDYFAKEYDQGRTPNPCVLCNSQLKFDHLVEKAEALGADYVATGHYAKIQHFDDGRASALFRPKDLGKDQSYFLFSVKNHMLKKVLFPLQDLTKKEVRLIAEEMRLATAQKHESQEICFVTNGRYTDFLKQNYPEVTTKGGDIVDAEGRKLGSHEGIHQFTVGQRKGLNISSPVPKYVMDIDPKTSQVRVGDLTDLGTDSFNIENVHWYVADQELDAMPLEVCVRYRAKPVAAKVKQTENEQIYQVSLGEKVRFVTPGQAAVFYRGDQVIGGGFIQRQIKKEEVKEELGSCREVETLKVV